MTKDLTAQLTEKKTMTALRFLLLEDSLFDAQRAQATLRDGGIDCELVRVETRADFLVALEKESFDLILADYALHLFSGISALEIAHNLCPEVPFILVSGTLGEELAIKMLKSGATDYVLKQRLWRLVPAVQQALREVQERSDRLRTEAARQRSEAQYRQIVDTAYEGIWAIDAQARTEFVNQQMTQILGYTAEEMLARPIFDFMDEAAGIDAKQNFERLKRKEKQLKEGRLRRQDGSEIWTLISASALIDERGEFQGAIAMVTDISERKQAEAAILQSEEQFRSLVVATSQAVWISNAEGQVLKDNPSWRALTGQSEEAFKGWGWLDAIHPEEREQTRQRWYQAIASKSVFEIEHRVRTADGTYRLFCVRAVPILDQNGEIREWISAYTDITDRKRAESVLRDSEERRRAALFASGTGTFRWNIRTNTVDWDENLDRLFGLPAGQTVPQFEAFVQLVHPDDRAGLVSRCQRCAQEGADFEMDLRVVWPDGSVHWLADKGKTFFDAEGKPLYMTGACVDITERKQAESERAQLISQLETERAQLEAMIHSLPDAVYIGDATGIKKCNDLAVKMFGCSRADELKHNIALSEQIQTCYIDTREPIPTEDQLFTHALQGSAGVGEVIVRQVKLGSELVVRCAAAPIWCNGEIIAAIAINTDITQRKRTEEALRQSEERYRCLVTATSSIVGTVDGNGALVEEVPTWQDFTGQTPEQYKGFGWLKAVHPDDRQAMAQIWHRAWQNTTPFEAEYRLRH